MISASCEMVYLFIFNFDAKAELEQILQKRWKKHKLHELCILHVRLAD